MNFDNLKPSEFKVLEPVYLSVKRDILIHIGATKAEYTPGSPEDIASVVQNLVAYVNDVRDPFVREIDEESYCPHTLQKICDEGVSNIPVLVKVKKRKVIASGVFAPVLYSASQGLLDGVQDFIGLDQVVDVYTVGDPHHHYDLDYVTVNNSGDPMFDNKGYDLIVYQPDFGSDTKGSYFFRVSAKVRIVIDSDHVPV